MPRKDPIKRKEYERQRYLNNREERLKWQNTYYKEHKEDIIEQHKEYNANHKKEKQIYNQNYIKKNANKIHQQKKKYAQSLAKYDTYYEKLKTYNEVRRDPKNPDLIQVKCKYKNCPTHWFNPTNAQCQRRMTGINNPNVNCEYNFYCSEKCKEMCPAYRAKDNLKNIQTDYSRDDQPQLRELVLERDNYTCQRESCGKSLAEYPDLKLICHHIFPLNEDPVESADIDNCITVCVDCHRWIHQNVPGCGYAELRCDKDHPLNQ